MLANFASLYKTRDRDAYGIHVEIVGDREGLRFLANEIQLILDIQTEGAHTHLMTESGGSGELSEVKPGKDQILVHYLDIRLVPDDWQGR